MPGPQALRHAPTPTPHPGGGQNHLRGPRGPEHPTWDSQGLWSGVDKWGALEGSGVGGGA